MRLLCTNAAYSTVHDTQSKYEIIKVKAIMGLHDGKRGAISQQHRKAFFKNIVFGYSCSPNLGSATITWRTRTRIRRFLDTAPKERHDIRQR